MVTAYVIEVNVRNVNHDTQIWILLWSKMIMKKSLSQDGGAMTLVVPENYAILQGSYALQEEASLHKTTLQNIPVTHSRAQTL